MRMSEEDVALLAHMCSVCYPHVRKKGLFLFSPDYAYYVPNDKSDLDLAKEIFSKNGINMELHWSRLRSDFGENVLRIEYGLRVNNDYVENTMVKIAHKHRDLYNMYSKRENQERIALKQKIAEMKKRQSR